MSMPPVAEAAAALAAAGWHILRLKPRTKAPWASAWPTRPPDAPESFGPEDNLGVALGACSGGLVDVDLDCLAAVEVAAAYLPETATFGRASRPRGHWLYQIVGEVPTHEHWHAAHVELRGHKKDGTVGKQTVFPPSWRWPERKDPPGTQPEQVAWYDLRPPLQIDARTLRAAVVRVAAASLLRQALPSLVGGVHHTALALAGLLRRAGWPEAEALRLLEVAWGPGDADPHRAEAVRSTYALEDDAPFTGLPTLARLLGDREASELEGLARDDALGYTAATIEVLGDEPPFNDTGNASRLLARYGTDLRYAEGLGWLRWTGTRWEPDAAGPWPEAEGVANELAASRAEGDLGKALRKWGVAMGNRARLAAAIEIASKRAEVRVSADELDADPWLLGTPAGVLELRTGLMREARREDLITRQTAVAPDFAAASSELRFDRFLLEVMGGSSELAAFLLRHAGWALTGDTSEHGFALWHGAAGGNGKSTLLDLLLQVWGDYGVTIATEILLASRGERHPTGLMSLRGRRLAVAHELPTGSRWDEGVVKRLTGSDRITARAMRSDFVEFTPTHHLVMTANARPIVRDASTSWWRRVWLVPWEVTFIGREDTRLAEQLAAEAPAVLARCVAGLGQWLAHGGRVSPPQAIVDATAEYREQSDLLGGFVEDELELGPARSVPRTQLYRAYESWCEREGEEPNSGRVFLRQLMERVQGLREAKRNGIRSVVGCALRTQKGLAAVPAPG